MASAYRRRVGTVHCPTHCPAQLARGLGSRPAQRSAFHGGSVLGGQLFGLFGYDPRLAQRDPPGGQSGHRGRKPLAEGQRVIRPRGCGHRRYAQHQRDLRRGRLSPPI
jgi:hypothetical protein